MDRQTDRQMDVGHINLIAVWLHATHLKRIKNFFLMFFRYEIFTNVQVIQISKTVNLILIVLILPISYIFPPLWLSKR